MTTAHAQSERRATRCPNEQDRRSPLDRNAEVIAKAWTRRSAGDAFEVAFEEARERLQAGQKLYVNGAVFALMN